MNFFSVDLAPKLAKPNILQVACVPRAIAIGGPPPIKNGIFLMPTFGFSAFLKLVCSNERPATSQIRQRLTPSTGGYDYHRSMKQRALQFLSGRMSYDDVVASASSITAPAEKASAISALENLKTWRTSNPGNIVFVNDVVYSSPINLFSVKYTPDFALQNGNEVVAFHIYNNIAPRLIQEQVYSALSLASRAYLGSENAPDDVSVLALREIRGYRLGEQPNYSPMGDQMASRLERLFQNVHQQMDDTSNNNTRRPDRNRRPNI